VRFHLKSPDFGSPGDDRGSFLQDQDEDIIIHFKNKEHPGSLVRAFQGQEYRFVISLSQHHGGKS
jgi:hypothetical protein